MNRVGSFPKRPESNQEQMNTPGRGADIRMNRLYGLRTKLLPKSTRPGFENFGVSHIFKFNGLSAGWAKCG